MLYNNALNENNTLFLYFCIQRRRERQNLRVNSRVSQVKMASPYCKFDVPKPCMICQTQSHGSIRWDEMSHIYLPRCSISMPQFPVWQWCLCTGREDGGL